MTPPIGATSYVYRYLLSDVHTAPSMRELIRMARAAGLDRFQICENARPLELPASRWKELQTEAAGIGLEISLGAMTIDPAVVFACLDRSEAIGASALRLVLETAAEGGLSIGRIRALLDRLLPRLEASGIRLAIENHFAIPSRTLAAAAAPYPPELVGFCLDAANSLRNFEHWESVFEFLGNRAFCYHLKDYRITGSNVGFAVSGAPFGEGEIGAEALVARVVEASPHAPIYLENWTPSSGDRITDIVADAAWLDRSISGFRRACLSAAD